MNFLLKTITIVFFETAILIASFTLWQNREFISFSSANQVATLQSAVLEEKKPPAEKPVVVWKEIDVEESIPDSFMLAAPFTVQAPHANWNDPWQEFCEEAVILMASSYASGATDTVMERRAAAESMLGIMRWEQENLGYHKDTGSEDVADTVGGVFGFKARVIRDITKENIKEEILRWRPVILPVSGKRLQNPYFSGGGPLYHMVLVIGYDNSDNTFVTHEPGTRYGREYRYDQDLLYDAIADWDHETEGLVKRKAGVVIDW